MSREEWRRRDEDDRRNSEALVGREADLRRLLREAQASSRAHVDLVRAMDREAERQGVIWPDEIRTTLRRYRRKGDRP